MNRSPQPVEGRFAGTRCALQQAQGYGDVGNRQAFTPAALRLGGLMARIAGWTPDIFWTATPAEAAMVLAAWADPADGGAVPPDAALRARLMEQFPDGR